MDMKKDRSKERSFFMQKWKGREVGIRSGGNGFYERARRAESLARCGERFFFIFLLKPGSDTGFQWGISPVATGDSGLCPENPQAFRERLERKLQQGCDLFYNSRRVERVERVIAR